MPGEAGRGARRERRETEFRREAAAARHAGKCSPPPRSRAAPPPRRARGGSRRQLGGPRGLAARPPSQLQPRGKVDMLWGWAPRGGGPAPHPRRRGSPCGPGFHLRAQKGRARPLLPGHGPRTSSGPALPSQAGLLLSTGRQSLSLQPADTARPDAERRAGVRQHGACPTTPTALPPALSLKSWYSSA